MNNWKIGTRTGAGFGVVILIAMALGLFAINRVGAIQQNADAVALGALPKVHLIGEIENNIHAGRALILEHVTARDQQERADVEREFHAVAAKNAGLLSDFEKLITTEKGRELFSDAKRDREELNSYRAEILQVSRQGTPESSKQAMEMLKLRVPRFSPRHLNLRKLMAAFNNKLADDAVAEAQATVSATRSAIYIGLTVVLLLAIGITIFTVRSITRPLAGAVEVLEHVANGEIPDQLDITSQDEVGQMLTSLNSMTMNLRKAADIAVSISEGDLTVNATALSGERCTGNRAEQYDRESEEGSQNCGQHLRGGFDRGSDRSFREGCAGQCAETDVGKSATHGFASNRSSRRRGQWQRRNVCDSAASITGRIRAGFIGGGMHLVDGRDGLERSAECRQRKADGQNRDQGRRGCPGER